VHVVLEGVVGSTAYGLARPGSDVDRLGVFAAPTEELHGLRRPVESVVSSAPEPDRALHEAAKWCRLALSANPTVSELVWLPDELYEVRTPLGEELIALRSALLSAKAVRDSYLGYAGQQFRKLLTIPRPGGREVPPCPADQRPRAAKHARHLVRLLEQGVRLHETGELGVRLDEPERVRELGERIAARPELAEPLLAEAERRLDRPGALPQAPDEPRVEDWLRRVRRAYWTP
jgi:predicted nucleotidyltransferase